MLGGAKPGMKEEMLKKLVELYQGTAQSEQAEQWKPKLEALSKSKAAPKPAGSEQNSKRT